MLKKQLVIFILNVSFMLAVFSVAGQDVNQLNSYVKTMITTRSSKTIKPFIKGNITLKMPGFQDIANKTKACDMLDGFLTKNKTGNYQLKKSGKATNGHYVIGSFSAQNKDFIIYVLFLKNSKGYYIQQIEIE